MIDDSWLMIALMPMLEWKRGPTTWPGADSPFILQPVVVGNEASTRARTACLPSYHLSPSSSPISLLPPSLLPYHPTSLSIRLLSAAAHIIIITARLPSEPSDSHPRESMLTTVTPSTVSAFHHPSANLKAARAHFRRGGAWGHNQKAACAYPGSRVESPATLPL